MVDFAVRLITPPIHAPSHQLLMDLIKVSAKCRCVLLVLEVPYYYYYYINFEVCCVYHPLCLGVCSTDTNLIAENGGAVQLSRYFTHSLRMSSPLHLYYV